MLRYSVYMPAYQAENEIAKTLARLRATAPPGLVHVWILLDGCTDGTLQVAQIAAREWPEGMIRLDPSPQNLGYGGTVRRGLQRILEDQVDYGVCLHSDGQYAPEILGELLAQIQLQKWDLLQGSRLAHPNSARLGGMPLYKWWAGQVLVRLENAVLGLGLSDYHSGYLIVSRQLLEKTPWAKLQGRFEMDLELIACAKSAGLRVGEHPIPTHYGSEESHLSPIPYGLRVLGVLVKYLRGQYRP